MKINRVVVFLAGALLLVGCAESSSPLSTAAAEESFRAWLAKYDPAAERKESGIYIRFIERGSGTLTPEANKSWLRLNYTLYALNGVVGETRSSSVARLINTWTPITHFVPDMIPFYSLDYQEYARICTGLRVSFPYLHAGDSVRIYIPTNLAYYNTQSGMNINSAYRGERLDYLDHPCYFDLRVQEVINDPATWEQRQLEAYVQARGINLSDSVASGLYMRILQRDPEGTQITADSSVRYYYASRFLDNHLIHSNVEAVTRKAGYYYSVNSPAYGWGTSVETYAPSNFSGSSSSGDSSFRAVLAKVLVLCRTGETVELMSSSRNLGSGFRGSETSTPQILPYQPQRLQFRILRWNEKFDVAKYDWSLLY